MSTLHWLPEISDWRERVRGLAKNPAGGWREAVSLANARLDPVQTNTLDATIRRALGELPEDFAGKPVRLGLLGSSTLTHLQPAIRVAGVRRGMWIMTYEGDYGQYWQELTDRESGLHRFRPTAILFALDAYHLAAGVSASAGAQEVDAALADVLGRIGTCWSLARDAFKCLLIHQLPLPVFLPLLGNNEHRLPGSRAAFLARLNGEIRSMAEAEGVDLLALDTRAAHDGLAKWHSPGLWHRAKQEVSPAAAPMFGEMVGRLLGARQGRSYKALVLDLDNTVWGGVVGDDGVDGLVIGQGNALGEAFVAFQQYARELSHRGVILAVCSKNDQENALAPFERHPDMVLKRGDIACFVANWDDKAGNLRAIAEQLNIGLDALVFVDDNPFERNLVRRELPMVAVPEVSDDPAEFAQTLADAGYFEAVTITQEDRERSGQYQSNIQREVLRASSTDLGSYLRGLEMQLLWRRFARDGLSRVVQLINKTNQFNLTTRRHTEADVLAIMENERAFGLQLRLIDRFGDNGVISVVIGKMTDDEELLIDTWLMSCRVLGRQVEPTTLNLVASAARQLGARRLVGEYIPTAKNAMVKEHYSKLGFTLADTAAGGGARHILDLRSFVPHDTFIDVKEG